MRLTQPEVADKLTRQHQRGIPHWKMRELLAPEVEAGLHTCAYCGQRICPGKPWDLGHDDQDRRRYSGPEHRGCNRSTARRRLRHSREW